MASTITAGNATNGLGINCDNTGILQLKTGTGAGTTAVTIDASQNATFAGNVIGVLKSGTAVASTSGTSIDFTGIPAYAKRVTVMFNGVSTNGASNFLVQLGTSGGIQTTGYLSTSCAANTTGTVGGSSSTTGMIGLDDAAANLTSGQFIFTLVSGNIWVSSHARKNSATQIAFGGGDVTLAGTLDRIRITTVNGTDTFDAGSVNILWE